MSAWRVPRLSREAIGWIAVAAIVLTLQWPMLKGVWYKRTNATPPPSAITWYTDVDAALADARLTGRPVLVDFAADWCPPCITMKHDVWPDRDVAAAVRDGYVPLLVDVDAQPEVAARYGIHGIPSVLVLDETGVVVRRTSFLCASGMRRFLDDAY